MAQDFEERRKATSLHQSKNYYKEHFGQEIGRMIMYKWADLRAEYVEAQLVDE